MRLFVAVDLPDTPRAWAEQSAETLRARLSGSGGRVVWVGAAQLHLTLVFLGEVSEATGMEAAARLGLPLATPSFILRLGGAGIFPAAGRPRVLWLGVDEGRAALIRLQQTVTDRLEGLPYRRESRPYSPHLTIARFRDGGTPADRRAVDGASLGSSEPALVDHVTLYQSRLTPRGSEDTARAQGRLAPPEAA